MHAQRVGSAVVAACLCALPFARAQSPRFVVQTIDGRSLQGAVAFDGSRLEIGGETLTLGDAMSLRVDDAVLQLKPKPVSFCVWLRSGSVIPCSRIDGTAAAGKPPVVRIDGASGVAFEVPLSTVAAMKSRANDPQTFVADRAAPDDNLDYLYVVKGGEPQRFSVLVDAIDAGVARFDLRGSQYEFAVHGEDSVAAIVFGKNTGFAPDRAAGARAQVALVGGELVGGSLLSIDSDSLRMRLDEGTEFSAPLASVRSVDVASDKLAWLSSMQPKVEQTAAFDRLPAWTEGRSPAGPGIRVGGATYARGFVLVPRTRLTFELGGRYGAFECVAGLDDRCGPVAHATMRVVADGKPIWESTVARGVDGPPALRLSIVGCKQLTLEADFGDNFDLGDLCAFADARVVVTQEAQK